MFEVRYKKAAEKFIKSNKFWGIKFMYAFNEIAENYSNIKKYDIKKYYSKDYNDIFRLRIGKYCAIFRVIENEVIILVFDIDSRGDIYK